MTLLTTEVLKHTMTNTYHYVLTHTFAGNSDSILFSQSSQAVGALADRAVKTCAGILHNVLRT